MIKSVWAVSEGGPDAVMSFRLAARVAANFDGAVDINDLLYFLTKFEAGC